MASNHVNILHLRPGMALVFQSDISQLQAQIDRFVVLLLDMGKQKAIGDLLHENLMKQSGVTDASRTSQSPR